VPRCPVCHASVSLETMSSAPFCSERCRLIDLGRWLEEGYSVPQVARQDEDQEDEMLDIVDLLPDDFTPATDEES
jgi:endogenous inhibitor of DNA gyrase (YacG/DUF329 family)